MDFVFFIIFVFSCLHSIIAFPENLQPISTYKDIPFRVFTGDKKTADQKLQFVQMMKPMVVGGVKRIAVAARENLYFLEPRQFLASDNQENISHSEILSWKSTRQTRELCRLKGQSKESCYNYLSVLETTNNRNLILCGTNAFAPKCANYQIAVAGDKLSLTQNGSIVSGKQRSPFGPDQQSVSLFAGGSLYSATFQSFSGGTPIIYRSEGQLPSLRTTTTSPTMEDPKFVKMSEDEKRILVYFNEIQELDGGEKRTVAQVAQVCKNDVGGTQVLLRMFTTFVKSRLNCSYHGFYLDEVRDVTDPIIINGQSVVYATFSTPRDSLPGSAVCSFTLDSIQSSMSGPFLSSAGSTKSSPTLSRHPGICPEERATNDELVFIKSHPQMEKQVAGSLLMTNQGQRWSAVAVDDNAGPKNVSVIFVGTENGHLVRFLPPANAKTRGVVISDQNVFDETRCFSPHPAEDDKKVLKIILEGDSILVAFKQCVIAVPLRSCEVHRCEQSCLGSANPYCGWNGEACVAFYHPEQALEQSIPKKISTPPAPLQPCEDDAVDMNSAAKDEAGSKVTVKTPIPPKSQAAERDDDTKKEDETALEQTSEKTYSFTTLISVGVVTFGGTIFILIITVVILRCCCCKRQPHDEEAFIKKQMEEAHRLALDPDEKRGSLSQKARQTYHDMKDWLHKTTTPVQSPQLKREAQPLHRRRQNDYTEAPTLKQKLTEQEKRNRRSSSRMASVSSTVSRQSRQDSIGCTQASQSLLTSGTEAYDPDLTLPTYVLDSSNILLTSRPTGDFSPSSSSPTRSNGSSPSYPDNGTGAAETGVLPTASAKLRRRNERAAHQTNEIMRESDTAIKDLENTLLHMEEHGLMAIPQPLRNHVSRQRLDSTDSGKGESPRNSLQNEQSVSVITTRAQRPVSLNMQKSISGRRQRLLSEGSYPNDTSTPVFVPPRSERKRSASGHYSNRSQPTTPDEEHHDLSFHQLACHSRAEVPVYATLPKDDCANGVSGRRKQRQQPQQIYHQQHFDPRRQQQHFPMHQPQGNVYNQMKLQRPHSIGEPKRHEIAILPSGSPANNPNQPTNFYPSVQVRGAHAQKMPYPQPPQHFVSRTPPKNHFTSLPRRNTSSPHVSNNNAFVNGSGFERPATTHRREKLPSLMRQTSVPGSTRPGLFVPPPTVP